MDYQKKLNDWFAKFEHRMESAVPHIVAETATEFFKERFRTEEWDKVPWPNLSPGYAAKKTRGAGRILTRTGMLQASITPATVSAERVIISAGNAKVPYARIHNEGGRIRGIRNVRGYHNSNFMGKKKRVQIQPHTRKVDYYMPQRQFMGYSKYLNQEIITRLTKAFNK